MSTPGDISKQSGAPRLVVPPGSAPEIIAEAFSADERIHFSTVTRRWTYEDESGAEWEYESAAGAWLPVVDEELLKKQQAAYSVAGVDEEAPAAPVLKRQKKRKEPEDYTSASAPQAGPSIKRGKGSKASSTPTNGDSASNTSAPRKPKNTAVFVTRLPPDTTAEELAARFGKCGVLEEDDDGDPKVKLYAKEDGSFSGDALVVYFKEESVALAVAMLDEAELRLGEPETVMSVTQAEFAHKTENGNGSAPGNGENKPRKTMDKKKVTRRLKKLENKLADWDSGDEFGPSKDAQEDSAEANKNARVVVLKHMFTLQELAEDASLLLDLKEDVREECSSLGEVTNVVLYDEEPEGVMTVKFRDPISAQACVIKMQGRFFAGRRVEASLYTGKQRFKKSGGAPGVLLDDEEGNLETSDAAEKKRLDEFANWLMKEGD